MQSFTDFSHRMIIMQQSSRRDFFQQLTRLSEYAL